MSNSNPQKCFECNNLTAALGMADGLSELKNLAQMSSDLRSVPGVCYGRKGVIPESCPLTLRCQRRHYRAHLLSHMYVVNEHLTK